MNKVLEALERIEKELTYHGKYILCKKEISIIETELKRVEEREERVKTLETLYQSLDERYRKALVKNQKQDEILRIIKEKRVDIATLMDCKNAEEYNRWVYVRSHYTYRPFELTPPEFNLLKEALCLLQ